MGITDIQRRAVSGSCVLLLALAVPSCVAQPPAPSEIKLEIIVKADGTNVSAQYTLECSGEQAIESSTLPDAAAACARLNQHPSLAAPSLDPATACTEIYGGPQRAKVSGTVHGQLIDSEFSRSNGCLISQWEDAEFLFNSGL
ncbi:hypothetical protein [Glutamicibacter sp. TV12E]|uniref:hypothetical protein n=1 Tax=Glutamicibacter sp. TV12E TaxID=3446362 RepID=UPI0040349781